MVFQYILSVNSAAPAIFMSLDLFYQNPGEDD